MAGPVETTFAALIAALTAALGGYGLTLYMKGDPVSQSIEPANVKTFNLTSGQTLESPYKGHFLDITKKDNLNKIVKSVKENKDWWEWAYQFKFEKYKGNTDLDPVFKTVEVGYSSTSPKALNKVCDSIYREDKTKFNAQNNKLVFNVGAFCTTGSEFLDISEPQAVLYTEAPEGYTSGVLKESSNRAKLVKTTVLETELDNYNEFWWDWAFKNLYQKKVSKTSDSFASLTKAFSKTTDNEALNQVCDAAYKKVYKDLKGEVSGTTTKPSLLNDISNFCSIAYSSSGASYPEPDTPTFVTTDTSYTAKSIVREGTNKNYLVDPDSASNENWWTWTFDQYYPNQNDTKAKQLLVAPFDKVYYAYQLNGSDSNNNHLNKACKTAYSKVKGNFTEVQNKTPLIDLIKRFCSTKELSSKIIIPTQ